MYDDVKEFNFLLPKNNENRQETTETEEQEEQ